jgi:hypothetical protein
VINKEWRLALDFWHIKRGIKINPSEKVNSNHEETQAAALLARIHKRRSDKHQNESQRILFSNRRSRKQNINIGHKSIQERKFSTANHGACRRTLLKRRPKKFKPLKQKPSITPGNLKFFRAEIKIKGGFKS